MKKNIYGKRKVCPSTKKGISLVEVLMALFVFSLAMVIVAGIFSGFFRTYRVVKEQQRTVEKMNFAMNTIAKTIRTSSIADSAITNAVDGIGRTRLRVYDYSQSACIEYYISDNFIQVAQDSTIIADKNAIRNCKDSVMGGGYNVMVASKKIKGQFNVDPTTASPVHVGKVTMYFNIEGSQGSAIPIQTTVSLRDYDIAMP